MLNTEIKVECKGGGSFVSIPPVFSEDGSTIFVAWKNVIQSYNTKTGKMVLQYLGLEQSVVGFNTHSVAGYECITACSRSGEIKTWKAESAFKLLEKHVFKEDVSVQSFHIFPTESDSLDGKALCSWKHEDQLCFGIVDLTSGKWNIIKVNVDKERECKLSAGLDGFAIAQGNKMFCFNGNKDRWKHTISKKLHFTCIIHHPTEDIILTGDSLGRVLVWSNIYTNSPSTAVYHWHTLPVKSLSFSTSGSYFYSGGSECVLVKWQMDNSLQKNFLPRLPSTIEWVSVSKNNLYVAVSTGDNGIRVLDGRLELMCVIQNLVLSAGGEGNIVFDPRSKALIMNGNTGHLQFYSPYDMSLLYSLDVVGKNKITQERDTFIENIDVKSLAISKTGQWMATIEQRNDKDLVVEVRLKFWKFDATKQKFELNTSVEYPHEGAIKTVRFQPIKNEEELKCVTIGDDKKFKIWQLQEFETVYRKGQVWKCISIGYYKDLPTNALAFSCDGSLLGIAFGHTVTTWLPDTCELKCSLLHTTHRDQLRFMEFGVDTQCHLIVSATKEQLSVWNLLTLTMMWTVSLPVSQLIADGMTPYMAVFTTERKLYVFSPGASTPVYTAADIVQKECTVLGATFVPSLYASDSNLNWYERSHLFFINSDKELYCLSTNEEMIEPGSIANTDADKTFYELLQPKVKHSAVTTLAPKHHLYTADSSEKLLERILEVPVHTMPPVRLMCDTILRSMVLQKNA